MIYYVSDYHFYHELARRRSRSDMFESVEQMNGYLIEKHNEKVKENDDVYILGDILVIREDENLDEKLKNTVGKLNGNLHLVLGNHDYKYKNNKVFLKYFKTVLDSEIIRDKNKCIHLYHYPIIFWYKKNKGAYHIYGHVHDENRCDEIKIMRNEKNALNACVEVNNYEPCTLEELKANNEKLK